MAEMIITLEGRSKCTYDTLEENKIEEWEDEEERAEGVAEVRVETMGTITARMGTAEMGGGGRGHDPPQQRSRHDTRITVSRHYSVLNIFLGI